MSTQFKLAGRYKLTAVDAITGVSRELAEFDNLITDWGLNRLGTGGIGDGCYVGSGSTAPANGNTSLVALVASNTTYSQNTGNSGAAPYYAWCRRSWRFGQGVAAGNISEVGVGPASNTLFSRALVKDSNGNPTTITVLSTEFLDVSYELRIFAPTSDVTFNANIAGAARACVLRAANVSNWSAATVAASGFRIDQVYGQTAADGDIGTVTQTPGGTGSQTGNVSRDSYSNNSYKATGSINWGLNDANFAGGIKSIYFGAADYQQIAFQCSFTPPIAKTSDKTLSLNVEVSWARA